MAQWKKFSCTAKRARIDINGNLLASRKQSNQDIAEILKKNNRFVKLLRDCCTPDQATQTQSHSALAAVAAAATASSSSSSFLLFDLKLADIVPSRSPCLGPLNVDKLNEGENLS
jgi:hypothetical protein